MDDICKATGEDNLPDTQKDTQPVMEEETFTSSICENGWGRLIPTGFLISSKPHIILENNEYTFGRRSPSFGHISISHCDVRHKILSYVSKVHFKIWREREGSYDVVLLKDTSSNGTFINKKKVGRNKIVPIQNNDTISVGKSEFSVYIFLANSLEDPWLGVELSDKYRVLQHLGVGGYAEVKLIYDMVNSRKCAIKKMIKGNHDQKITREINILSSLKHPCIVILLDVIDTPKETFMVLEFMPHGDLNHYLRKVVGFTNELKCIFYQVVLGVDYLHRRGVVHRDIKAQNILLRVSEKTVFAKIADFGLSKVLNSFTNLKTPVGTLMYTAPEVIIAAHRKTTYTSQVDIWSLGVLLFFCLSRDYPFEASENITVSIVRGKITKSPKWRLISQSAALLVDRMLVVDPSKRLKCSRILLDPWLQTDLHLPPGLLDFIEAEGTPLNNNMDNLCESPSAKKLKID